MEEPGCPVDDRDIRLNLSIDDLEPVLATVLETLTPREMEVQDRAGNWYLLRIRPYRTTKDKIEGLLVVLLDIDQHRRTNNSAAREPSRNEDELRRLAASLLTSQEAEGRRVARELHDDICQKLAVLEIDTQQLEPQIARNAAAACRELEGIRNRIDALSEDVRRISHSLHPSVIDDLGLAAAVRSLVEDFREREQMIVTFTAQNLPEEIPPAVVTGLYRIAQEALRNVAKHAGKTHVKISLKGGPGGVHLKVIDAGEGFDVHARHSGVGLIRMAERVRMMAGTFSVESQPGEGTRIGVDVPRNW